jgi:D-amino-acid dehydrogenase
MVVMVEAVVIGGGVIGVTTACELASRGIETELLEAREELALETSFANGSLLTPSMADPWNSPGVWKHLLASVGDPQSAVKLRPGALPGMIGWGIRFLLNSRQAPYQAATRASFLLAAASVKRMDALCAQLPLSFDQSDAGTLKIFSDHEEFEASKRVAQGLKDVGLVYAVLDRAALLAKEPRLIPIQDRLIGALYYPGDRAGDARSFSLALAACARQLGARIRTGVAATGLALEDGRVVGVNTTQGVVKTDCVIVAAGNESAKIARTMKVRLSINPVKGYSITYSFPQGAPLPTMPIIDDANHAVIVPLGARLRIAGTAEFTGRDWHLSPERVANLERLIRSVYPQLFAQDLATGARPWTAHRPMSADGRPYIGSVGKTGVWFNTGHGHLGWTMAAGSAQLLVDLVLGNKPVIDPLPYAVGRAGV